MTIDVNAYAITVRPLSPDDGGGFVATIPDLPGCMGDGETEAQAIADVREAAREWIMTARAFGDAVPVPSDDAAQFSGKWVQRVPRTLHRDLSRRADLEGVSLNSLVLALIAQGLGSSGGRDPQGSRRRSKAARTSRHATAVDTTRRRPT